MPEMRRDDDNDYREEAAQERYERAQQRKWAVNEARHVLDPDREWPDPACADSVESEKG